MTLALAHGKGAAAEQTVDEDARDGTVTATLDHPAPHGGISLNLYPHGDDTASRDADYTMPDAIAIAAGERSGTATLKVVDDARDEDDEQVNLTVLATNYYDAELAAGAVLTIADDDTAGVTIATAASPLEVNGGGTATYTVVLDSRPRRT